MKRVTLFTCDNNDTWARDVAPISLIANKASKDSFHPLRLLDFCFNGWGEKFAAEKDNRINRQLHKAGLLQGVLESHKDFVLEGGSIESDGERTLFTTTSCLMAPHRNQPLTQEDIDKQLRLFFPNVERVIWLDYGQLAGDDTDGHIDTIVRIAPNDTLLYIGCDDKEDEHYEDFRLLEEQLKQLRTLMVGLIAYSVSLCLTLSMMMTSVCLQHMQTSSSSMELYLFQPTTNPKRTKKLWTQFKKLSLIVKS